MTASKFEKKIEPSSAKMYFHYYGQLLHQQNMMQDYVRTGVLSYLPFKSYRYQSTPFTNEVLQVYLKLEDNLWWDIGM